MALPSLTVEKAEKAGKVYCTNDKLSYELVETEWLNAGLADKK